MPSLNTPTQPNMSVVVDRLDRLSTQISDLDNKFDCQSKEQTAFMVQYTKAHAVLDAKVDLVNDKAERAHQRIDKLTQAVWAIALPVLLGVLAYIWGLIAHTP